ncbi:MAG: hypothetical protein IIC61_10655 [Proteobacteria bacterium]|nr:hypothetical protein [Pseudomonadota bacterium]
MQIRKAVTLQPLEIHRRTSAMKPGDIVEIEVEGVGILRNHVVAGKWLPEISNSNNSGNFFNQGKD